MSSHVTDLGLSRVLAEDAERHPTLRPRDAASLILIDRSATPHRVLVGKRASAHVFMPDMYVFPGGRRDAGDSRKAVAAPLRPEVLDRLLVRTPSRFTATTAHGLAVAAARELEEEVSLTLNPEGAIGAFRPDLSKLRYVARAVTPPGRNRRFDTRFFACFTDEVAADTDRSAVSAELIDLTWLPLDDVGQVPVPVITRMILGDLENMLEEDADLGFGRPVPFYHTRKDRFLREII